MAEKKTAAKKKTAEPKADAGAGWHDQFAASYVDGYPAGIAAARKRRDAKE